MRRAPRQVPTAAEWARALPRGARVPWAELEAHVLREHPAVLRLMGPAASGVRASRPGFRAVLGVGIVLGGLVLLAIVWAPIWGLATLSGDAFGVRDVDGAVAVPVAGVSLLVAAVLQLGLLVRALRGRPDAAGIGGGTAVLAVLIGIGTALVGVRQDVPAWPAWVGLAAAVAALGLVNVVLARVLPHRTAQPRTRDAASPGDRLARDRALGEAIAALPEAERTRLLDDRRRAIEWLRLQGTVSPDEAARAMRAPLGRLGAST
ncbi:hypothetical protein [Agromyces indicus]|uniref:Uncharacterized protein n=1 Tax=Agromyces indicus TaxID=758919 RepID=A0ABU1FLF1_9MICO|nr:hypothetical protein [Agromyces indicus]MDR5692589.1 hypothetical protein [Agromyces indicus]